jgi:hypothetical protein
MVLPVELLVWKPFFSKLFSLLSYLFFTFGGFFFNSLGTIVAAVGNGKADLTILFLVETCDTTFFNFDGFFFVLLESIADATLGGGLSPYE